MHLKIIHQKSLNFAISLAIYDVLLTKNLSKIAIKWPNDIVSGNNKVCGILIENTFKGDRIKNSIIGIGLNVNQEKFPKTLKNITSLKLETSIEFDLDELLKDLLLEIKNKTFKSNSNKECRPTNNIEPILRFGMVLESSSNSFNLEISNLNCLNF